MPLEIPSEIAAHLIKTFPSLRTITVSAERFTAAWSSNNYAEPNSIKDFFDEFHHQLAELASEVYSNKLQTEAFEHYFRQMIAIKSWFNSSTAGTDTKSFHQIKEAWDSLTKIRYSFSPGSIAGSAPTINSVSEAAFAYFYLYFNLTLSTVDLKQLLACLRPGYWTQMTINSFLPTSITVASKLDHVIGETRSALVSYPSRALAETTTRTTGAGIIASVGEAETSASAGASIAGEGRDTTASRDDPDDLLSFFTPRVGVTPLTRSLTSKRTNRTRSLSFTTPHHGEVDLRLPPPGDAAPDRVIPLLATGSASGQEEALSHESDVYSFSDHPLATSPTASERSDDYSVDTLSSRGSVRSEAGSPVAGTSTTSGFTQLELTGKLHTHRIELLNDRLSPKFAALRSYAQKPKITFLDRSYTQKNPAIELIIEGAIKWLALNQSRLRNLSLTQLAEEFSRCEEIQPQYQLLNQHRSWLARLLGVIYEYLHGKPQSIRVLENCLNQALEELRTSTKEDVPDPTTLQKPSTAHAA